MSARGFIVAFAAAMVACGGALMGLNEVAADMDTPKATPGCEITRADDNSTQYARLPGIVARGGTEVLLLGTSHTKMGFRPEVRAIWGPTTNAALMNASYETMRLMLSHWPAPPGSRVIIEAPFGLRWRNGLEHFVEPPSTHAKLLALLDARPVLTQFLDLEGRERMRSDCRGFPMTVFEAADPDRFDRAAKFWHERLKRKEMPDMAENLEGLRRLVQDALDRGYRVDLWVPPMHACSVEAVWHAGYGERSREWLRSVADLTAMTARNGRRGQIRAWDFSGYTAVTTEPLPRAGSGWRSRYFSDPSHIMGSVGDDVARQMTGQNVPAVVAGRRLDPSTVGEHLERQAIHRREYLAREPEAARGCMVKKTAGTF